MKIKFNVNQFEALTGVCKSIRSEIDKQAGIKERFSESSAGFMYYAGEVEGLRFALQKLEDLIYIKDVPWLETGVSIDKDPEYKPVNYKDHKRKKLINDSLVTHYLKAANKKPQ